jgi:hypothetical protein
LPKKLLAATTVLVMIFLMQPMTQMETVKGNPLTGPSIGIQSPQSYKDGKVYQETTVDVAISIHQLVNSSEITDISFSLDGNSNNTLSISNDLNIEYLGTGTIENLTNGYHSLTAYTLDTQGKEMSISTTFLVNTTFSYPTLLLSPLNTTYSKNEVPLNYTIDKEAKYVVSYSLDTSSDNPVTSNTTLTGLSEGHHTITIRAMNGFSIYSEKTVYFEINIAKTEQPLTTSILIVITTVAVIIALIALVFYKRKKANK